MHSIVEPIFTQIKNLQCYNSNKWGNHVSKKCIYQPICVICDYDDPPRAHIDYPFRSSQKHKESCLSDRHKCCINYKADHPASAFDKRDKFI